MAIELVRYIGNLTIITFELLPFKQIKPRYTQGGQNETNYQNRAYNKLYKAKQSYCKRILQAMSNIAKNILQNNEWRNENTYNYNV